MKVKVEHPEAGIYGMDRKWLCIKPDETILWETDSLGLVIEKETGVLLFAGRPILASQKYRLAEHEKPDSFALVFIEAVEDANFLLVEPSDKASITNEFWSNALWSDDDIRIVLFHAARE